MSLATFGPMIIFYETVICTASLVAVWLLLNWVTRGSYPYLTIWLAAMLVATLAGGWEGWYFLTIQYTLDYQVMIIPPLFALAAFSAALALSKHEAGVVWPAAALIVALGAFGALTLFIIAMGNDTL